jgi:hypothetical protein
VSSDIIANPIARAPLAVLRSFAKLTTTSEP